MVFLLIGGAAGAFAQPSDVFEVASIKPSDAAINHTMFSYQPGGGIRIEGATLRNSSSTCTTFAITSFRRTGWMTTERYTILAKGSMAGGPVEYIKMNDRQRKALAVLVRKRMERTLPSASSSPPTTRRGRSLAMRWY